MHRMSWGNSARLAIYPYELQQSTNSTQTHGTGNTTETSEGISSTTVTLQQQNVVLQTPNIVSTLKLNWFLQPSACVSRCNPFFTLRFTYPPVN